MKDRDILKELGEKIRQTRKRKNLTQAELAEKADISANFMGCIERGEIAPSIKRIAKIASALNIEIEELFKNPKINENSTLLDKIFLQIDENSTENIRIILNVPKNFLDKD